MIIISLGQSKERHGDVKEEEKRCREKIAEQGGEQALELCGGNLLQQ